MEIIDALPIKQLTPEAKIAYDIIKRDIPREDFWFRKMWNINLPDAKDGHAILVFEDGKFFLETYSVLSDTMS